MSGLDEHALIERIAARLAFDGDDAEVSIGIGDDAAVLTATGRPEVSSVDAQVEGVHFDRAWLSPEDLGFRSYVSAMSDLAAMGARPRAALLSWVLPPDTDPEYVLRIADGVREASELYSAPAIGGNLSSGTLLHLSTTALGSLVRDAPWTRGDARPGDSIYVTGPIGAAALGWRALRAGHDAPEAAEHVARWRRPRARFDLSMSGADVSACVDISDGLVADASHLARASGVDVTLELAAVPTLEHHRDLAAALGEDADRLVLGGGEDYELLFTSAAAPPFGTRVGRVEPGAGEVRVLDRDGAVMNAGLGGHRHFG